MKKSYQIILSSILGIILLMLSACMKADFDSQALPNSTDEDTLQQITFPASTEEKNEFNQEIFDISPFNIEVSLPNGWHFDEFDSQSNTYLYNGVWSRVGIFDDNNNCVGAVGYNIFEPDEEAEDEKMSIYNQIALGNDYNFNVKHSYNVVKEFDAGEVATVDVYYSPVMLDNKDTEVTNYGILAYNNDKSVYVAFEFDSSATTDETIASISNSINFVD